MTSFSGSKQRSQLRAVTDYECGSCLVLCLCSKETAAVAGVLVPICSHDVSTDGTGTAASAPAPPAGDSLQIGPVVDLLEAAPRPLGDHDVKLLQALHRGVMQPR